MLKTAVMSGALAFVSVAAPPSPANRVQPLEPGVGVERRLTQGEVHTYSVLLSSGEFFHLQVDQNHLDAAVRVLSPKGTVVAEVDNAIDREDPLTLSLVAPSEGTHRVEIRLRSPRNSSGVYRLTADAPRSPTADDHERIHAERLRAEADALRSRGEADSTKKALELYETVLVSWRALGDRREEAATLGRMSDALGPFGQLREALARAEEMLALWRLEADRRGEAASLNRVGLAHSELGDQRQALVFLEQALELRRADGNAWGKGESLNDIAVARGDLGELPEAVALYTEALEFARASGDRLVEAMVLKNRAVDYLQLGETDRALADLRDALARFRILGDRRQQGITEYSIGDIFLDRDQVPEAMRHYEAALVLLTRGRRQALRGLHAGTSGARPPGGGQAGARASRFPARVEAAPGV